ncbi:MAG: hypothetical protein JXA30_01750 [Deltaproteobacteria bacterium]|nr:hypothetical protein [Deltaproteobacteria bacterium]
MKPPKTSTPLALFFASEEVYADGFSTLAYDPVIRCGLGMTNHREMLDRMMYLRACLIRSDRVFRSATVQDLGSRDERRAEYLFKHDLKHAGVPISNYGLAIDYDRGI